MSKAKLPVQLPEPVRSMGVLVLKECVDMCGTCGIDGTISVGCTADLQPSAGDIIGRPASMVFRSDESCTYS